jgi:hypothetical protein
MERTRGRGQDREFDTSVWRARATAISFGGKQMAMADKYNRESPP